MNDILPNGQPEGFPVNGGVGIAEITDGTSNTIAMSEAKQSQVVDGDFRGGIVWGPTALFATMFSPNSTVADRLIFGACDSSKVPSTMPCGGQRGDWHGDGHSTSARGYHTGGVNCALADASVQFISDTVNVITWRALGTARNGEAVSLP